MMHAAVLGGFPPSEDADFDIPAGEVHTKEPAPATSGGPVEPDPITGASSSAPADSPETDTGAKASSPEPMNPAENGRILWRTDTIGDLTWLYVLSAARPDFTHIVEQFGWPGAEQQWATKDYDPFLSRIEAGQHWQFRLHANPVRTVDKKIYAHITVEQQKLWLSERAERNGFSFEQITYGDKVYDSMQILYRKTLKFRKRPTDKDPVTLSVATYEGNLIVEDADLLRRALTHGIGRAKAYGCGLLTLAPVK
jgi:CRISPR system Cascade subunit CasE